jgi:thioesterase domain-containing protein/acyl carrier protein
MVPAAIVKLAALPLLPNGKIDRRALPAPEETSSELSMQRAAPRDTVEFQLKQIWEDVLGVRPIGIRDNFFDLGGHSLLILRLISRIHQLFKQELPLSTLFEAATVEQLACVLRRQANSLSQSSLVEIQSGGSKRPYFCVHPGSGNVLCYVDLARHLGHNQPFYGLQSVGLDGRREPYNRVEDMAAHYIEAVRVIQPQGPYLLGGWSFGGLVAFEMAQQLQMQNQEVALLSLLDTWVPDSDTMHAGTDDARLLASFLVQLGHTIHDNPSVRYEALRGLNPDEQLNYVLEWARRANLVPPDAGAEQIRRLASVYKANIRATQSYKPKAYPKRITLFRASERFAEDGQDPTMGWSEIATGGLDTCTLPGSHYTIVREPHVRTLATWLGESLNEAQRAHIPGSDQETQRH